MISDSITTREGGKTKICHKIVAIRPEYQHLKVASRPPDMTIIRMSSIPFLRYPEGLFALKILLIYPETQLSLSPGKGGGRQPSPSTPMKYASGQNNYILWECREK